VAIQLGVAMAVAMVAIRLAIGSDSTRYLNLISDHLDAAVALAEGRVGREVISSVADSAAGSAAVRVVVAAAGSAAAIAAAAIAAAAESPSAIGVRSRRNRYPIRSRSRTLIQEE